VVDTNNHPTLEELELNLQNLSHDRQTLFILQSFAEKFNKTKDRQMIFNKPGALIQQSIEYQDMINKGIIGEDEDPFILLQGDIVSTDTAYFLGDRLTGTKFAIASSTCDLIPGRRNYATLLRIQPISANNPQAKQVISEMLAFKSTKRMYLPPLAEDAGDILANAVLFDGIVQIELKDLFMATRHFSLSLVGWRIFGSLVRNIMVRAGESEVKMRSSFSQK
jgi:hypothetical protein